MLTTLSTKGQVTIPVDIRNRLRLGAGDKIDFVFFGEDRIEMVPRKRTATDLKGIVRYSGRPVSLKDMDAVVACGGVE